MSSVFLVSIGIFLLIHLIPGDPAREIAGENATLEQVERVRDQLGLTAPLHEQYFNWLALTYGVSLVGNPAVAIPAGRDATGLPFGIQIIGRHRGDVDLLSMALGLEEAFQTHEDLARPRPDLAALQIPFPSLRSDAHRGPS
jgi:hypothetical protein